jgi:hypothetical protein
MSCRVLRPGWKLSMKSSVFGIAVATALLLSTAQPGANAQGIGEPFLACAAEADDARRLACFDAAVAQLKKEAGHGAVAAASAAPAAVSAAPVEASTAPAEASPVAAAPAVASAGAAAQTTAPAAAAPAPAAATTAPAGATTASAAEKTLSPEEKFGLRGDLKREKLGELSELVATATGIAAKPRGELVITLDNGQVWTEIAPGSTIRVKVGDQVKIEAGTLGSFILIAPNGRSSKVSRIR